jgi:hypothetical protein
MILQLQHLALESQQALRQREVDIAALRTELVAVNQQATAAAAAAVASTLALRAELSVQCEAGLRHQARALVEAARARTAHTLVLQLQVGRSCRVQCRAHSCFSLIP